MLSGMMKESLLFAEDQDGESAPGGGLAGKDKFNAPKRRLRGQDERPDFDSMAVPAYGTNEFIIYALVKSWSPDVHDGLFLLMTLVVECLEHLPASSTWCRDAQNSSVLEVIMRHIFCDTRRSAPGAAADGVLAGIRLLDVVLRAFATTFDAVRFEIRDAWRPRPEDAGPAWTCDSVHLLLSHLPHSPHKLLLVLDLIETHFSPGSLNIDLFHPSADHARLDVPALQRIVELASAGTRRSAMQVGFGLPDSYAQFAVLVYHLLMGVVFLNMQTGQPQTGAAPAGRAPSCLVPDLAALDRAALGDLRAALQALHCHVRRPNCVADRLLTVLLSRPIFSVSVPP
eukprot:EG_transcript_16114